MKNRRIRALAALLSALLMLGGIADCNLPANAYAEEIILPRETMVAVQDEPLADTLTMETAVDIALEEDPAAEETAAPESPAAPAEYEPASTAIPGDNEMTGGAAPGSASAATPEPTMEPAPELAGEAAVLAYSYSVRSVRDPLAETALPVIIDNEGSYTSVNANDNGALSIGKIQWHASRALSLMRRIVAMNPEQAYEILGEALYSEITNSATKWGSRIVDSAEKALISKLLGTSEGKQAQDEQALDDVSGYLQNGRKLGLESPGALIYFADIENQNGSGGSKRIANAAIAGTGSGATVTLDYIHQTALADSKVGRYATRRNRTYNKIKALGLDEVEGPEYVAPTPSPEPTPDPDEPIVEGIRITDVGYPRTYVINNIGYTVKTGLVQSDAELKTLTMDIQNADGESIETMPKSWQISGKKQYLSYFDEEIPFSRIKTPGRYSWTIIAEDSAGRTALVKLNFDAVTSGSTEEDSDSSAETSAPTVNPTIAPTPEPTDAPQPTAAPDEPKDEGIRIRDVAYPKTYVINNVGYTVKSGLVESDAELKTLTMDIQNADGESIETMPKSWQISGKKQYLSYFDEEIPFSRIKTPGRYSWTIIAEDSAGRTALVKLNFTAVEDGSTEEIKPTPTPVPAVTAEQVVLNSTRLSLELEETARLTAEVLPENAEDKRVSWESSDDDVATVFGGLVLAVNPGEAIITCKSKDGGAQAECRVTVRAPKVLPEKMEVIVPEGYLGLGESVPLQVKFSPEGSAAELEWRSKDSKIVEVDAGGVVTGMKLGTTTVYVESENGLKDSLNVKVVKPDVVAAVILDHSGTVTLNIGETLQLNVAASPSTAETEFKWSSSSSKRAKVTQDGLVTALKTGTATITAKAGNGKKDTVKIKVVDPSVATAVTLDRSGTVTLAVGETLQLNAEVTPATAETKLKWSSSSSRARVNQEGLVTAKRTGTATITVKTENGKKDTVKIKVVAAED